MLLLFLWWYRFAARVIFKLIYCNIPKKSLIILKKIIQNLNVIWNQ